MKPETARELLIPYLDGELDKQTAALLEKHLAADPQMQRELDQLRELDAAIATSEEIEPDVAMRERFDAFLADEKAHQREAGDAPDASRDRVVSFWRPFPAWLWRGVAAAILIFGGVGVGWQLALHSNRPEPLDDNAAEVRSLRNDVAMLRALVLRAPTAQTSASYRLQAMSYASEIEHPDPEILQVLLTTLSNDESPNVRLAALEALSRFASDRDVKLALARALPAQTDPFVQIGLIRLLGQAGGDEAREPLQELLVRPDVSDFVKSQAQQSLTYL